MVKEVALRTIALRFQRYRKSSSMVPALHLR